MLTFLSSSLSTRSTAGTPNSATPIATPALPTASMTWLISACWKFASVKSAIAAGRARHHCVMVGTLTSAESAALAEPPPLTAARATAQETSRRRWKLLNIAQHLSDIDDVARRNRVKKSRPYQCFGGLERCRQNVVDDFVRAR